MRGLKYSAVAASLIGGAMLMFGAAAPASATTLPGPAAVAPGETAMVEEVRHNVHRGHPRASAYGPRRHAPHHYGHARPGFGFGITLPGVTLGLAVPHARDAHVQWCMDRYRTYDPATDTYAPRVGVRAHCNSPYN